MGHIHLNTADPDVQKKFWTDIVGAQLYDKNGLSGVSVPGAIILMRKAAPTGGSDGSSVHPIGFTVPALAPSKARVPRQARLPWVLTEEIPRPSAAEKNKVFTRTRAMRQNSPAVIPPNRMESASTGKTASKP